MGYAKLYHTVLSSHKIQDLSAPAWWLYSMAIVHCSQNETDGALTRRAVKGLAYDDWNVESEELVEAGLFERDGGGFRIHDYTEHQTPASEIARIREQTRERVRKHRERARNAVTNDDVTPLQTPLVTAKTETETETETEISLSPYEQKSDPVAPAIPRPQEPRERGSDSLLTELWQIEAAGYERWLSLGGEPAAAMRELAPVAGWEMDALLKTRGRSWQYAVTTLRGMREESTRPAPAVDASLAEVESIWEDVRRLARGSRPKNPTPLLDSLVAQLGGRHNLAKCTDFEMTRHRARVPDLLDALRCNGSAHA